MEGMGLLYVKLRPVVYKRFFVSESKYPRSERTASSPRQNDDGQPMTAPFTTPPPRLRLLAVPVPCLRIPPSAKAEVSGEDHPPRSAALPYLRGLTLRPTEPTPLHLLLRNYLRLDDRNACVNAFWEYWPGIREYHPRENEKIGFPMVGGSQEDEDTETAEDQDLGDGWAWGAWEGIADITSLAGIAEVVATCFVGLKR